jgi:hypothetical protein
MIRMQITLGNGMTRLLMSQINQRLHNRGKKEADSRNDF